MKKITLLFTVITLTFALSACGGSEDHTYDERGLVSESCAHLENIDDWQPVWCDEFDEDGLPSASHWGYDVGGHGWGNQELQYYTDRNLKNAFVEDGILHIRAIREDHSGNEYTSARLVSKFFGDWEYARIQVKAKMPSGRGTWPAIWMLPSEWRYGGWPHSGEIDIMEYVGHDPGVVHGTIHTGAYNHGLNTQIGYSKHVPTAEDEFHLYEMIWEPASIILKIDGEQFAQFGYNPQTNLNVSNEAAWPFDQPFHLILNLAIGGMWGGQQGIDESAFPTEMQVKYVRVYQKDYAGMTTAPPEAPERLELAAASSTSARIHWRHAEHDVQVHKYEIYVDNTMVGSTTVNAFNISGLDPRTNYQLGVVAVDFAGNRSDMSTLSIQTGSGAGG